MKLSVPALLRHVLRALALLALFNLVGCLGLPTVSKVPERYTLYPGTEAQATVLKTADELALFGQWWKPASDNPKAVIILLHGTAAHVGAYTPWAEFLSTQNYAMFAFDMRGWGQSQGFGRRAFVRHHDEYVNDLKLAFEAVKKTYPNTPIYLQGESLGAGIALQASIRGGFPMDGLILNAAPVYVNLKAGPRLPNWLATPAIWTAGLPGRVAPNFPLFPMQYRWAESWIWEKALFDEFSLKAIPEDPYFTHSAIAAAYVTQLGKGAARIRANMEHIKDPFIVLQGSKDYLVSPASAEYLIKHAASRDKTMKFYEGMSHCTLHDAGRGQVWIDIVAWLDKRLPATGQEEALRAAALPLAQATPEQTFQRLHAQVRE